jgi:hypothetical protein
MDNLFGLQSGLRLHKSGNSATSREGARRFQSAWNSLLTLRNGLRWTWETNFRSIFLAISRDFPTGVDVLGYP